MAAVHKVDKNKNIGYAIGPIDITNENYEESIIKEIFNTIHDKDFVELPLNDDIKTQLKNKLSEIQQNGKTNKEKIIEELNVIIDSFKSYKIENFKRIIDEAFLKGNASSISVPRVPLNQEIRYLFQLPHDNAKLEYFKNLIGKKFLAARELIINIMNLSDPIDRILTIVEKKNKDKDIELLKNIKKELEEIKKAINDPRFNDKKKKNFKDNMLRKLNSLDNREDFTMDDIERIINIENKQSIPNSELKTLKTKYGIQKTRFISSYNINPLRYEKVTSLPTTSTEFGNFTGNIGQIDDEIDDIFEYCKKNSDKKKQIIRMERIKKDIESLKSKKESLNETDRFKKLSLNLVNKILKRIEDFETRYSEDIKALKNSEVNSEVNTRPRSFLNRFKSFFIRTRTNTTNRTKKKHIHNLPITVRTNGRDYLCMNDSLDKKGVKFTLNGMNIDCEPVNNRKQRELKYKDTSE